MKIIQRYKNGIYYNSTDHNSSTLNDLTGILIEGDSIEVRDYNGDDITIKTLLKMLSITYNKYYKDDIKTEIEYLIRSNIISN